MTTLIVGGRGMLGRALEEVLAPTPITVDIEEIDITRFDSVWSLFSNVHPTTVVNAAAMTDVDGCEGREDLARRVNAEGVQNLADACRECGARFVHVSTDYVFDGTGTRPYRENDPVHPVSAYGRTKLEGEEAALLYPDTLVVRVSWLFGFGREHFLSLMARLIREGKNLKVIDDQTGRVTYSMDAARAIAALLERKATGIVHFANSGVSTRYDQVRWMAETLGKPDHPIEPVPSSAFPQIARRPEYSVLDTTRYEQVTGQTPPPWQEAVRDFLTRSGWL
ncbi:MAG TPA: dTDP-4-dehydrorhamnose reductase [Thermoanaerobaculia bacterium]|nr:dTDP-4-dehydrorhamnose reductase [Thermoanaerobaculia bacterium]HUM28628.1 dTDP-4-dehydrorhamnose reductase [Thermoanaerobaculia bacterium]HXK66764.1 dTDP-4-dehydrorhamnose reductase [Thermoanaerobaculia bacterium]